MKSLFSVVCLTVLVGMATPCCLPDQGSFDFTMQKNSTALYMGSVYSYSLSVSGSGSFDFAEQKFYLSLPEYKAEAYIELSTNKKSATMVFKKYPSLDGLRQRCFEVELEGKMGKPWQCVLDNSKIFVFNALGQGKYVFLLPSLAFGVVTMKNDTCLPTGLDMEYYINKTDFTVTSNVHLELTNIGEKVVDEAVFKAPCKAERRRNGNIYVIPTPDEFVQLIYETVGLKHASESKEASPESDEDNANRKSDDGEDSDESESEDEHDKRKKRDAPWRV